VSILALLKCNNGPGQITGLHAVKSSSTQGLKILINPRGMV
jgi:hypothetical protein